MTSFLVIAGVINLLLLIWFVSTMNVMNRSLMELVEQGRRREAAAFPAPAPPIHPGGSHHQHWMANQSPRR